MTKITKRITSIIVALALTLLTLPTGMAAEDLEHKIKFTDVPDGEWYAATVNDLAGLGIFKGYEDGTFHPEDTMTVAEFAKIVITSKGKDPGVFNGGHWADLYIAEAKRQAIITKGEFEDFDKPITRLEIAMMLIRAIKDTRKYEEVQVFENHLKDFAPLIPQFRVYVVRAYSLGLIKGYPDRTFKDDKTATRAEAAIMMDRFLNPEKRVIPNADVNVEYPPVPTPTPIPIVDDSNEPGLTNALVKKYREIGKTSWWYGIDKGEVVFDTRGMPTNDENYHLDKSFNPDINEQVKAVVYSLLDEESFTHVGYHPLPDKCVYIPFCFGYNTDVKYFTFFFYEEPCTLGKDRRDDKLSDNVFLQIELVKLWRGNPHTDGFRQEYVDNKFKNAICTVFGNDVGQQIYDYAIDKYTNEVNDRNYDKTFVESKEIGGIKVDCIDYQGTFDFYFSK